LNQLLDQLIIFKPNNLICEIIGIIFHDSIILKIHFRTDIFF
jgi:hypothetical protein